jgi:hypothetical protein
MRPTPAFLVRIAAAAAIVGLVGGCTIGDGTDVTGDHIEGIVTEVTGDLTTVQSFVILDGDGDSHLFTPQSGLLFYGGPLSHLRDHIVTGERVRVVYERGAYGDLVATSVLHADGDSEH